MLRSGNSFGMWDGEAIDVVDSQFDFAEYGRRGVEEEPDELSDDDVSAPDVDEPLLTCEVRVGGMGRAFSCVASAIPSWPGIKEIVGEERMPTSLRKR